jgi:hypothetical protein
VRARYVGGGSPRLVEAVPGARSYRSPLIRQTALALLAALLVLPLALVPRAEADIYWTNQSYSADDEILPGIGRAHLDGSEVNPSFITGAGLPTRGIAIDAEPRLLGDLHEYLYGHDCPRQPRWLRG